MDTNQISSAIGVGSGIDIKAMAESLTNVERAPRTQALEDKIAKAEKRVSGYAAIMFGLKQIQDAFKGLNDLSDFSGATVRNSSPSAFEATALPGAELGQHTIQVNSVAKPQITRSGYFSSATQPLNAGAEFNLQITVGNTINSVKVTDTTPEGVVEAINTKSVATGVEARLVATGDSANPYTILLTGTSGLASAFTVAQPGTESAVPGLSFSTTLQSASDANLVVDGLSISRSTNTIDDAVPGIRLDLLSTTTSAGTISLSRDTAPAKEKITALTTAYNEFQEFLDTMGDPKSTDEEYGGILATDTLLRYARDQARSLVTATSNTPGPVVTALRDIGITLDRAGRLQTDAVKLDVSLKGRFEEIAKVFSGDTENASLADESVPLGIAGEALRKLETLMATDGPILSRSKSAESLVTSTQEELSELQARMDGVYERYLKQLAAMDSVVSQMNSLRDSLSGQFEGLMAMYTKK
jgi:flagellar hook-associated protein 2